LNTGQVIKNLLQPKGFISKIYLLLRLAKGFGCCAYYLPSIERLNSSTLTIEYWTGRKEYKLKKSEVAYKIMGGEKLTLAEFQLAVTSRFFEFNPPLRTDGEVARAYLALLSEYYETPDRRGYICGEHPNKVIAPAKEGYGETFCAWGIHLNELDPKFLTRENWKFLRRKFGRQKVKELLGK
jgi:hypothetical protein